jgi:hypothetical protein
MTFVGVESGWQRGVAVFTSQLTLPSLRAECPSAGKAAELESFLLTRVGAERSEKLVILPPSGGTVGECQRAEKRISR